MFTAMIVAKFVVTISVPLITDRGTITNDGSLLLPIVEAGILVDAFKRKPLEPTDPIRFMVNRMTPSLKKGCTLLICPRL